MAHLMAASTSDQAFWSQVIESLVQIGEGKCAIDDDAINAEQDPRYQEIMAGLLCLHEDLEFHKAERDRALAELWRVNANLEAEVQRRTEELSAQIERLETTESQLAHAGKLATLGELVASIAHEINTPLLVVRGYNEQIRQVLRRKERVGSDDIGNMLSAVDRAAERIVRLVSNLKDFSRPSLSLRQPVSLHAAVQDACVLVSQQLRAKGIQLTLQLCSATPQVLGDAMQLEQVFINLLINACDAIVEDGRAEPGCIVLRSRIEESKVCVEVEDNGPGMAEALQSKLFEAFFTTKPLGAGTGLGLSISQTIIDDHGGTIRVDSSSDRGSVFCVELPLVTPGHAA